MRLLIQKVKNASVTVDDEVIGKIGPGLFVLLGIHKDDTPDKISWLVQKLVNLRIFPDDAGKMNLSLLDIQGEALIVSQFTLYGNCAGGRRPDFLEAAPPPIAIPLYEKFIAETKQALGDRVATGRFGAYMEVALINDGPVTLLLDSRLT
jgi:D-aminoacyl-tRNA deacylase